jgi:hypothetical protein
MTGSCHRLSLVATLLSMLKRAFFIVVGVLLLGYSGGALCNAQSRDARCEWTDCGDGPTTPTVGVLPECGEGDRGACGERCRTEFDKEHFRCIERCLAGRCREVVVEHRDGRRDDPFGDADLCLEGESKECEVECRDSTHTNQARCRLDCLFRRCPSSRRSEISEEAAKPGAARCRRCRERNERDCRRSCGVGFSTRPGSSFNGLGSFGCEKACLVGACGAECAW